VDCTKQVCDFDGNVRKLLDKLDIAGNLAVNTAGATSGMAQDVSCQGFTNLAGSKQNPIDLPRGDLLARDAVARWRAWLQPEMPSFEPIRFERIGLREDRYRRALPAR